MLYFQGCEVVKPFDELYFCDDDFSISNVVMTLYFEEFEFETMRDTIFKNTEDIHRCRSKVVMRFGQYWFQKMSEKEWN